MREIKFRAWDKRLNEMVYSNKEDVFYINTKGAMFMYAVPKSESGLKTEYVIDYEIMQFTGLKDSKEKDIYEGDIIYVAGLGNCLVSWDKSDACWLFKQPESSYGYQDILEDIERIVGNIYDNPELLEGDV